MSVDYRNLSPIRRPQPDLNSKPFFFFSDIFISLVIWPLKKLRFLRFYVIIIGDFFSLLILLFLVFVGYLGGTALRN